MRVHRFAKRALAAGLMAAGALAVPPLPAAAPASPPPAIERWVAILDSPDASAAARTEAVAALRRLAAGRPEEAATREAAFYLAGHLGRTEGATTRRARRVMALATTLYPDDPRTPELLEALAPAQVAAGDGFGAHLSFSLLLRAGREDVAAPLMGQAAVNAIAVNDETAAFHWSHEADLDALDAGQRADVLLARLESAYALGRNDLALDAAEELERIDPERLHRHPGALLAAARAREAVGDPAKALPLYETFVNLHATHTDRPGALLSLGLALGRTGEAARAAKVFEWLIEDHPAAPEATGARLELIELGAGSARTDELPTYLAAAREAGSGASAKAACDRLLERFIGAGLPLEAVAALAYLAREPDTSLAPLAARGTLQRGIGVIVSLLDSRGDDLGVVAVALEVRALGLPVPRDARDVVAGARRRLGLAVPPRGLVEQTLSAARELARDGRWSEAGQKLQDALRLDPAATVSARAAAVTVVAESLWREGRDAEALDEIERLIDDPELAPDERRALRVLRADVRFAAGDAEGACADYRTAATVFASPWVERQAERCAAADTGTREESGG